MQQEPTNFEEHTAIEEQITRENGLPRQIEEGTINQLRKDILNHFQVLGLPSKINNKNGSTSKEAVRLSHAHQRKEVYLKAKEAFSSRWPQLLQYVANGYEVNPRAIQPALIPVNSSDWTGYLFRFATLLWSVPVSPGYGRRMRFLVMDQYNGKLIGIFALGDPVFNLKARDNWIGWDQKLRRKNLVHVMDAYVVGAVPPYAQLLGGKLVFSLIASQEVGQAFYNRYNQTIGWIDKKKKYAQLALVTVTSALGKSSLYNRLKLRNPEGKPGEYLVNLLSIGETRGFGHFHLSSELFERLRQILIIEQHPYANAHKYGQGPNWRIRVTRVGLKRVGLDDNLIRHGINRQVYALPLAKNFKEFLLGQADEPILDRPPISQIASVAIQRWVIPRADRRKEYKEFRKDTLLANIEAESLDQTGYLYHQMQSHQLHMDELLEE